MYRAKNNFKLVYLLLLFLLLFQNFSASVKKEEFENKLASAEGKDKIGILINLMEMLARNEPGEALKYGDDALTLLKKFPNKENEAGVYFLKGWTFHYKRELDSALYYAELTGKISREAGFTKGIVMESFLIARVQRDQNLFEDALKSLNTAEEKNEDANDLRYKIKILNEYGAVYRRLSRYDEALEKHLQALELLKNFNDEDELTITFTYLGIISDLKGNYDEALTYHQQALEQNKINDDLRGIAASTHNIGILYQKIDNYELSLEYYSRALKYWKELDNKPGLAATYNSIGAVNELTGKYSEALKYYIQALDIWENLGNSYSVSIALNNIGSIYERTGNYKEAVTYLKRAISMRENIGDKNGMSASLVVLSAVYDKMGNVNSAIAAGKKGLELAQETGSMAGLREAHNVLSEVYENNGLYKEALLEHKNYKAVHDSMFNSESQQVIAEMQEKYKSEEQKQEIEILQKESEIEALYRTILIAGLILVLLILILLFNRYRLKRKAHDTLEKLHESEMESASLRMEAAETKAAMIQIEYDLKKKELEAARKLQLSMLPSKLPQHPGVTISALMLTATEVGGDYYDFSDGEEGSLTIVIGDAAGHGAQAGIIVTAAKSVFNLLSGEKDITEILRRLNFSLRKMQFTNLFMAFGILRLNDHTLEIAGAGMPPAYIYRTASGIVETSALKGLPLGTTADFNYQKTSIQLNKGDVVVVMSDGFPELFNNKNESIGFEKIPAILKESGEKSPEEIIKHFKCAADEWLDGTKQHDDMTFVVLKIKD